MKTIAVSGDVYELLLKFKLPNESLNDVIRRALKKGRRLSDIAGSHTLTKEDWKKSLRHLNSKRSLTKKGEIN